MRPADERESVTRGKVVRIEQLIHPRTGGVDDEIEMLHVARGRADAPPVAFFLDRDDLRELARRRPFAPRRLDHRSRQLAVVDLRVPVREAAAQTTALQWGALDEGIGRQHTVPPDVAASGEEVVEHEPDPDLDPASRTVVVDGEQNLDRLDELRRVFDEPAALAQRLVHEADVQTFEVTQTAVDQLRRRGGGLRAERPLLVERDGVRLARQLPRDSGAVDPPSDDRDLHHL